MEYTKRQPQILVPQVGSSAAAVNQPDTIAASAHELAETIAGTGAWHAAALDIARGASRYLRALGSAVIAEIPLADGRRADLMALDPRGGITILEVKSCLADFRTDSKWEDY